MAFKVNYGQQRAERNRIKAAKKEAKLREQDTETARRKADRDGASGSDAPGDGSAAPSVTAKD